MIDPASEPSPLALDLGAVAATLRRRLAVVVGGAAVGGLVAAGIVTFVTPRFDGHAMMLIRTSTSSFDPTSMVKDRLGSISELLPSSMGLGGGDEELATELALLQSRAVLGTVVDSLHLEVIPREPARLPPADVVDSVAFTARFKPYKTTLTAGANRLADGVGTVWSRRAAQVKLMDREDAIDDLADRLTVRKTGGDAIALDYRARDSVTAAAVPNLVAAVYMVRRKTVDRGLNQRRLEFLNAKADSVRGDLRKSTDQLADVAEASGAGASADIAGRALADEIGALEARLSEIRAGEVALDSLVAAVQLRHVDPQTLAGFPDLLRSPALNDLISQIATVETNRTVLLATRPESAPQVIALQRARDSLVAGLLPIATAYRQSLARQRASVERDLGAVQARLNRLPGQAAAVGKEQAEVTRLAALNAGMGAEVLQARLAALAEGGDVRLIDEAVTPRREAFPRPVPTVAICLVAGLLAGVLLAVLGVPVVRRV
jgi:tyrosine-protein kinase Etk/Wzc